MAARRSSSVHQRCSTTASRRSRSVHPSVLISQRSTRTTKYSSSLTIVPPLNRNSTRRRWATGPTAERRHRGRAGCSRGRASVVRAPACSFEILHPLRQVTNMTWEVATNATAPRKMSQHRARSASCWPMAWSLVDMPAKKRAVANRTTASVYLSERWLATPAASDRAFATGSRRRAAAVSATRYCALRTGWREHSRSSAGPSPATPRRRAGTPGATASGRSPPARCSRRRRHRPTA
jgi:hypothetical protein